LGELHGGKLGGELKLELLQVLLFGELHEGNRVSHLMEREGRTAAHGN